MLWASHSNPLNLIFLICRMHLDTVTEYSPFLLMGSPRMTCTLEWSSASPFCSPGSGCIQLHSPVALPQWTQGSQSESHLEWTAAVSTVVKSPGSWPSHIGAGTQWCKHSLATSRWWELIARMLSSPHTEFPVTLGYMYSETVPQNENSHFMSIGLEYSRETEPMDSGYRHWEVFIREIGWQNLSSWGVLRQVICRLETPECP